MCDNLQPIDQNGKVRTMCWVNGKLARRVERALACRGFDYVRAPLKTRGDAASEVVLVPDHVTGARWRRVGWSEQKTIEVGIEMEWKSTPEKGRRVRLQ